MQDLTNSDYRKAVLDEILGAENKKRKAESFRRSEIYNLRAEPYIEARLLTEFPKTASSMRKVLSINPTKRIVDKQASVYLNEPERTVVLPDQASLSDDQVSFWEGTYDEGKYNSVLQYANRVRKYQKQCAIQVIPFRGVIGLRVYQPHQYDVIPMENDPETALAYIVSAYDRSAALAGGDGIDQKIADQNDGKVDDRRKMIFVWWSNEYNFKTDGYGNIVSEGYGINPVGDHCFIDSAEQKENEFFVRRGSPECNFAIDLAIVLSDTANINKHQGFAQLVVISQKPPMDIQTGPENAIYLQAPNDGSPNPDVKFINPNPDLNASISLVSHLISLFMTSVGQDPKLINTDGNATHFKSGLDRFLAQIESFEASKEDFDHFSWVESEVFRIFCLWANLYAGTAGSPVSKIEAVAMPKDAYMSVKFKQPELFQTQTEREASEFAKVDRKVQSILMAIENLTGLDRDGAVALVKQVKADNDELEAIMPGITTVAPPAASDQTKEAKAELAASDQNPPTPGAAA